MKNKKRIWIIYCHRNKLNDKRYIGLTQQKPNSRWKNGLGYQNDIIFYNAIQKYSWDNFEHIILENNIKTIEEARVKEQYWISYYHTWVKDPKCMGYNATKGGEGTIGYNWSSEGKKKLSAAKKGKPILKLQGKKLSAERIEKIRKALTGRKQPKELVNKIAKTNTGKKRTEIQKQKIGIANGLAIVCVETNQQFYSIAEAARQTGINRHYLMKIIKNNKPCKARILNKYSDELKNKIKFYNDKHFKVV